MEKNKIINFLSLISLVSFSVFLFFFRLGSNSLSNWDEAWYADISRNIFQTGNYLTLIWNKEPFFDKPPLYPIFSAVAYKIFGVSEFSARFFSALAGVSAGIILYELAKTLFDKKTAIISFIVLNSTMGFLYRGRTGNLDVFLAFWIILSILSFYKGYMEKAPKWFLIMGISIAFAFLTKGVIAFLFPGLVLIYLLLNKSFLLRDKFFLLSILMGLFISSTWIYASYAVNGELFLSDFFLNQTGKFNLLQFRENFSFDYFYHLKSGLKFWFIFLIPSLIFFILKFKKKPQVILVLYFALIILFLSFSKNKSNWFIVFLYPIIALIISYFFTYLTNKIKIINLSIPLLIFIIALATIQNLKYKNEYIVPDISIDEKKVAFEAKKLTNIDDSLYLSNYYYPTTVFYSARKVYAVYSDHNENKSWWILPKSKWPELLKNSNVVIITTEEEYKILKESFKDYDLHIIFKSGSKLLVKVI